MLGADQPVADACAKVFSVVFAPAAVLMGVPSADVGAGRSARHKLVANEFVAFVKLTSQYRNVHVARSYMLATYALDGLRELRLDRHPARRHRRDGARRAAATSRGSGPRALFAGFLATLINASIASLFLAP